MQSIFTYFLVVHRKAKQRVYKELDINENDLIILSAIYSITEVKGAARLDGVNLYCSYREVEHYLSGIVVQKFIRANVKRLLSDGYIDNNKYIDKTKATNQRHKYSLSGKGIHILKQYSKFIYQEIERMNTDMKPNPKKYSFPEKLLKIT